VTITLFWLAGASAIFTYLIANKLYLALSGRTELHGITTKSEMALLFYQETADAFSWALAWPLNLPLGALQTLRYLKGRSMMSLARAAHEAKVHLGDSIDTPPRDERSLQQLKKLHEELALDIDAAFGAPPLVKFWPPLVLSWEQFDQGIDEHPLNTEPKLTIEQRQQYYMALVHNMLKWHAGEREKAEAPEPAQAQAAPEQSA